MNFLISGDVLVLSISFERSGLAKPLGVLLCNIGSACHVADTSLTQFLFNRLRIGCITLAQFRIHTRLSICIQLVGIAFEAVADQLCAFFAVYIVQPCHSSIDVGAGGREDNSRRSASTFGFNLNLCRTVRVVQRSNPCVAHFRIAVIQTALLGCIDGYTILCAGKQCSTVADFFFCSIIRCCEALFVQQSVMNHLPYNQILVYIVFA